jgi:hypothetical protein
MQLDSLAEQIQARNAKAGDKAYTFLDPTNVARSTQI